MSRTQSTSRYHTCRKALHTILIKPIKSGFNSVSTRILSQILELNSAQVHVGHTHTHTHTCPVLSIIAYLGHMALLLNGGSKFSCCWLPWSFFLWTLNSPALTHTHTHTERERENIKLVKTSNVKAHTNP